MFGLSKPLYEFRVFKLQKQSVKIDECQKNVQEIGQKDFVEIQTLW